MDDRSERIHGRVAEIVDTPAEAAELELAPLIVREPLEAYLDSVGLGAGGGSRSSASARATRT